MADLLPSTPDTSPAEESDPRVVGVDSDDADDLLSALSSDTARALLAALHENPTNPAELADRVDTSLQNTQYHLSNLEEAGLIDVVDTVYSEKGREMNVYAPADRPLVVYAGKEEETSGLRAALSRLLGAVAALAVGSAVVQTVLTGRTGDLFGLGGAGSGGGAGAGAGTSTATATPDGGGTEAAGDQDVTVQSGGAESTSEPTATEGMSVQDTTATQTPTDTPMSTPVETATATPTDTPTATEAARTATESATAAPDMAAGLPPGLLFFAGGCLVLAVVAAWYWRGR